MSIVNSIKKKGSYGDFYNKILNNENFSFARYNDGEWGLILKKNPNYSVIIKRWGEEMSKQGEILKEIVNNPVDYYIGISPWVLKNWGDDMLENSNNHDKMINSHIFHDLSKIDFLNFLELLKIKNTIIVGPKYLSELNFYKEHVITPEEFVWDYIEDILPKLDVVINKYKNPIIVYSASIATNSFIHKMYDKYKNKITQIDMGSSFDPYCGVASRSGHQKFMNNENIEIKKIVTKK
jgi:hypothetical protein